MQQQTKLFLLLLISLLLCVAGLFGYRAYQNATPSFIAVNECSAVAGVAEPQFPWRYRQDSNDIGIDAEWFTLEFDDSNWDESDPGQPWEWVGYEEYDGVAWYRATFIAPESWKTAYLGSPPADDAGRVWINGIEVAHQDILKMPIGEPVTVAFRVDDFGGFGGIKEPVLFAEKPHAALLGGRYISWVSAQQPTEPMPNWVTNGYHAWTFTGAPNAENEAIITAEGAIVPYASAPQIELWFEDENGQLHTTHTSQNDSIPNNNPFGFSLEADFLPMPLAHGWLGSLLFDMELFSQMDDGGTFWRTKLRTEAPVTGKLYVVVRPLGVTADTRPIYNAAIANNSDVWINDHPLIAPSHKPDTASVSNWSALMENLDGNERQLGCAADGDGTAVLAYDLNLTSGENWELTLAMPTAAGNPIPDPDIAETVFQETKQAWIDMLDDIHVTVPDAFVMNGYKASIGYLQLALDADGPHPGPLAHDALWVRDAAYIGETLLMLGQNETVADFIPSLFEYQEEDGYVPSIIAEDGPRPDVEWDAQGQLIYTIAAYYRFTGDEAKLADWYPAVRKSADFLRNLRKTTANAPIKVRSILPPSRSAEDLGPATDHHYWDDFWAIAGLENGAYLANELGETDDAQWMQQEADDLRDALRASIVATMGETPEYIPNSPDDLTSPAMARGSSNVLYPETVFERDDPMVVSSFDVYYERFIEPNGGIYKHIFEQWWPYGGLGLARDYTRLGRHDILHQILGWTLANQTLPGTFAWAEQVSPGHRGFSGGDMPHAWAASSYVTLIREMVVLRDGESLEILSGVPVSWLLADRVVSLDDAPTAFGTLNLLTESELVENEVGELNGRLTLTLSGAQPPDGFKWRLQKLPSDIIGVGATLEGSWLTLPKTGGEFTLIYDE